MALRWRSAPGRQLAGARLGGAASSSGCLRQRARWAGVGIGLATAIKLTPALFIVYLLVTRQWRAALTALGTALGVTIGDVRWSAERESAAYFGEVLWQTDRVGAADMTPNQSLAGVLARLYDSADHARCCCGCRSRCCCSRSGCPGPRTRTPTATS